MTTEMMTAFSKENSYSPEEEAAQEIDQNANQEPIDIGPNEKEQNSDEEKKQKENIEEQEAEF